MKSASFGSGLGKLKQALRDLGLSLPAHLVTDYLADRDNERSIADFADSIGLVFDGDELNVENSHFGLLIDTAVKESRGINAKCVGKLGCVNDVIIAPSDKKLPATVERKRWFDLGAGLHIILGRAASGKSFLLKAAADEGFPVLTINEPYAGAHQTYDVLASTLVHQNVVFVDSFKNLLATSGGTTLAGGISSGFLTTLTDLSIVLATTNRSVIATLNPGLITDVNFEALQSAIAGAATSISVINSQSLLTSSRGWSDAGRNYVRFDMPQMTQEQVVQDEPSLLSTTDLETSSEITRGLTGHVDVDAENISNFSQSIAAALAGHKSTGDQSTDELR